MLLFLELSVQLFVKSENHIVKLLLLTLDHLMLLFLSLPKLSLTQHATRIVTSIISSNSTYEKWSIPSFAALPPLLSGGDPC